MFHLLARNPERTFYNGKDRLIQPFRHCPRRRPWIPLVTALVSAVAAAMFATEALCQVAAPGTRPQTSVADRQAQSNAPDIADGAKASEANSDVPGRQIMDGGHAPSGSSSQGSPASKLPGVQSGPSRNGNHLLATLTTKCASPSRVIAQGGAGVTDTRCPSGQCMQSPQGVCCNLGYWDCPWCCYAFCSACCLLCRPCTMCGCS